ncbi:MAG: hydroxymethylglutaryl-CoA lyase [Egibacteraceae bacterium]
MVHGSNNVEIVEVAPRDGLQNEDTLVSTGTKISLIERVRTAGARRVEAVSFAHPDKVPQMADAEQVMAGVSCSADMRYAGLVLNRRGLDRALRARVDEITMVVVVTDTFSLRNQGMKTAAALDSWAEIAAAAKAEGLQANVILSAAFGCPFEGEVAPQRVLQVASEAAQSDPDELAFGDTIGVAVPDQVRTIVDTVREAEPDLSLRCHFHNTRNTGYANALAAVEAGVNVLDASVGGIGGCPFAPAATGNIATEDLVYLLQRSGYETGLDLEAMSATGTWISKRLGRPTPALLGRAGGFPPTRGGPVQGSERL